MKITRVEDLRVRSWYRLRNGECFKILYLISPYVYCVCAGQAVCHSDSWFIAMEPELVDMPLDVFQDDPYTIRTKFKVGDVVKYGGSKVKIIGMETNYSVSFDGGNCTRYSIPIHIEAIEEPEFKVGDEVWIVMEGSVSKNKIKGIDGECFLMNICTSKFPYEYSLKASDLFKTSKEALEYALAQEKSDE